MFLPLCQPTLTPTLMNPFSSRDHPNKTIEIAVGVSELFSRDEKRYQVKRNISQIDKVRAILFQIHGVFMFSDTVQRAALPVQSKKHFTQNYPLMAAGYGTESLYYDNFDPRCDQRGTALHGRLVYANMDFWDDEAGNVRPTGILFSLMNKGMTEFKIGWCDKGGPVWDPTTGLVVGFLLTPTPYWKSQAGPMTTMCVSISYIRDFIEEQRLVLNTLD